MDEARPKRKYEMTPEHKAKVIANLARARLAPKEKVYRKTEKRHRANLNNLGIAHAKRRQEAEQEAETLRAKMEAVFPAPEAPPPPIDLRASSLVGEPEPLPRPSGVDEFEQATRLIARRLRKVHGGRRREGRRIMRVLSAAIQRAEGRSEGRSKGRSQRLSVEQAAALAAELVRCLETSRLTAEARTLNRKIKRLLAKMIETRYGAEAAVCGFPLEHWLEQMEEEFREEAAARRGDPAPGFGVGGSGFANAETSSSANPEARNPNSGSSANPEPPIPDPFSSAGPAARTAQGGAPVLPLPDTEEEFRQLLARALDLEDRPELARALARAIWNRLHVWPTRHAQEAAALERFFTGGAARPLQSFPDPYGELRDRTYDLPKILKLDKGFRREMAELTANLKEELEAWVELIPWIQRRRAESQVA